MGSLPDVMPVDVMRAPVEGAEEVEAVDVSVIVPVAERPEPLAELYREYAGPLAEAGRRHEFLFVTEPRFAHLTAPLGDLVRTGAPVRILEAAQPVGEAALLKLAAERSRGAIVVTLPAYRRIEAASLPWLIERVEAGADLVVARRWPRRDSLVNRVQNRLFNTLVSSLVGGEVHDIACGVRAMRRDLLLEISLYGDFSRFLPLLALRDGYRVEELPAPQHRSDVQPRIYSPGIYMRRLLDILGVYFLLRFTDKPLRFFGLIGSTLAGIGGIVLAALLVERLRGQGIADRPLLLLGALLVVLGVQAIALGLIGEIIVHLHAPGRRPYRVARPGERETMAPAE